MKLQETIRRILREELYSPAGKEIIPNKIVVHKSNPMFRDRILEEGLKVRVGECYQIYVNREQRDPNKIKCKPVIFATNSTKKRDLFDSTYDDDIWEINTEMIPDVKWYVDRHYGSKSKHIVTYQDIPRKAITLIYEGTGESEDLIEESIRRILREESEIPVSVRRRINMIDKVIDIMLPNMYPCDYNSADHFVTGILDEIRWYLIDSKELTGIERVDIENYILDYKYDELVEYFNERCMVLKESERPQYQIRRERIQKLVDDILNDMKRTCEIMNSEDDEIISFGACELIDADVKVSVSEVAIVNDRKRVLVVIKYKNWRYLSEDEFVYELSKELRKWIGDNYVEVEDYINTFPREERQW